MSTENLQKAKDSAKILKNVDSAYKSVISIATSGVFSNVIRLVIMVLFGIGYWIFSKKMEELNIKYAKNLSVKEQEELRAYLIEINKNSDDSKVTDLEKDF